MRLLTSIAALALLVAPAAAQTEADRETGPVTNRVDTVAEPWAGAGATGVAGTPPVRFRETSILQLEDTEVVNLDGEELGEISNVVRGPDNRLYAVLEFGGYFNIGEEHRLIDLSRMFWMDDSLVLPGLTMEQLDTLPKWQADSGSYTDVEDEFGARIGEYSSDRGINNAVAAEEEPVVGAPDTHTGSIGTPKDEVEVNAGD